MQLGLGPLLHKIEHRPALEYVLATVVGTRGSSYRKAGAMMLLPPDDEPLGLVSGGCLEGDLAERARAVRASRQAQSVHYDLAGQNDALFGLGLGCGGEIDVLLELADRDNGYAGLAEVAAHWHRHAPCWLIKGVRPASSVVAHAVAFTEALPPPFDTPGARDTAVAQVANDAIAIPVTPPWQISVCGAGVDAVPLVQQACALDWRVCVTDHRPAYAVAERFDTRAQVAVLEMATQAFDEGAPDAIVIMSHNLQRDADYLKAALASDARYIGLLGPVARRKEVCSLAGVTPDGRVHGPAGLDLGATLPETIALSILAQVQAVLAGRAGGSLV